ncbi:MAG: tRNA pseudouridine(38-40) synthase TruA [Planctomycetota bacterium]|jgi:tRNA pseudouridine38-40 synthase
MPRYKLTVAYDGTCFHGWQKQKPTAPGGQPLRTVQGVLEEAVRAVVREPVLVVGASRTDSGVHARGQVAAFSSVAEVPLDRLPAAINARLPDDVQVRGVRTVSDEFDPITDCVAKGYRYRLAHDCALRRRRPLFGRHFVAWTSYHLDPDAMDRAARHLEGEHDFASFTRLHHGRESTVRTVDECRVQATGPGRCTLQISGNGFLYNMIARRGCASCGSDIRRDEHEPRAVRRASRRTASTRTS